MIKIQFKDIKDGVPFVVLTKWSDVYMKADDKVFIIASKFEKVRLLVDCKADFYPSNTCWLVDVSEIPFKTQPEEAKAKFKVGDIVRVLTAGENNYLLVGSLAEIRRVHSTEYEVKGCTTDGRHTIQYGVPESQLEKVS